MTILDSAHLNVFGLTRTPSPRDVILTEVLIVFEGMVLDCHEQPKDVRREKTTADADTAEAGALPVLSKADGGAVHHGLQLRKVTARVE